MITNIKEAKELVVTYRSITINQLRSIQNEQQYTKVYYVLKYITGFDSRVNCPLCQNTFICYNCIHTYKNKKIVSCIEHNTYQNIIKSKTVKELYNAINKRANYLEKLIEEVEKDKKVKKL